MLDADGPHKHHSDMTTTNHPTFIAFASPKGGVGKSTSCLAVAGALAAHGHPVHIVDFDQTQTIWRWYSTNPSAQAIANLTVEQGTTDDIKDYLKQLWYKRQGYVLVDLAGALTSHMLQLAAFAHLTITPAKLNEPDILEANKLSQQLLALGSKVGKPINHRILINEVPALLAGYQTHTLKQIDNSPLQRFQTLVHVRAAYPESFLTGLPPHFADRSRPTIAKAVDEIEHLLAEVYAVLEIDQQKAAA
jgi:chromosome partitioning protein